jgi:outer membrane immunogenic protein
VVSVFRAGDRAGLNQEGIEMKKLLLAGVALAALSGSAVAADLARPAYAPPPPVYTWTGLYWGVNVGYSWGHAKDEVTLLGVGTFSESQKVDGVVGGFQSGYNYQFGQWVLGLETDFQASGQKGGTTLQITAVPVTTLTTDHKLTWFGTSRTRLGVLWSPNVLLYGTAGVAYGTVKDTATITAPGASVTGTFKDVKAGWTAGAGVEGTIGGGWTAKLEYLYIDLGKTEQTLATPALGQVISETRRFTDNIVRVGFNYRWGGSAY